MIVFTYYFDGDDYGYEYEPDMLDVADYLEKNLSNEEIANYVREWFYELPEEDQHDIMHSFEETNFDSPNFVKWVEEDKNWCVSDVLMDESILEYFEDELKEYFEDDAYEMFKDAELYRKDPYGYNGVSPSDFY